MNVFLIGYRGTGKSTVARILAQQLGWLWADADVEIERHAGQTVAEIFAAVGEVGFRDLESSVVEQLAQRDQHVIALGGGAVLRELNRLAIGQHGVVVWLEASAQALHARLQADEMTAARRPNLTSAGGLPEIQAVLAQRTPIYRQCASFAVDTEGKTPQCVADEILRLLHFPSDNATV